MLRITLAPVGDFETLEARWRALEARAEPSFFRGWTFLGCLAAERFRGAWLLSATQDGCDVALALLGQGGGRLWLNQTGVAALDAPYVEHNGLLAAPELAGGSDAAAAILAAAAARAPLRLAGIGGGVLGAARAYGWLAVERSDWAPRVRLGWGASGYLNTLSAGTRAQIRRAYRAYGEAPRLARAATLAEAQAWFDELCALHGAAWRARGQPGAFATTTMRRFHTALIERGWERGEVDLLRVAASGRVLGVLYMFMAGGDVLSYQSGFAFTPGAPREKPGLVSHALAIEHYAQRGFARYDMLAGADRYKLALAKEGEWLHWATLYRPWSAAGLAARAREAARRTIVRLLASPRAPVTTAPTAPP